MHMTKFYLVRHGYTDYIECDQRKFIGQGRDLAPLTELGKEQILKTSSDERLKNAEMIISSPYTRALQSAAILSAELQLDINVEIDLHEWLPDTSFQFVNTEQLREYCSDFELNRGIHPTHSIRNWEEISTLRKRVKDVIEKYQEYDYVIVVCHGMVIRSLKFIEQISNGEIVEYNYPDDEQYEHWTF